MPNNPEHSQPDKNEIETKDRETTRRRLGNVGYNEYKKEITQKMAETSSKIAKISSEMAEISSRRAEIAQQFEKNNQQLQDIELESFGAVVPIVERDETLDNGQEEHDTTGNDVKTDNNVKTDTAEVVNEPNQVEQETIDEVKRDNKEKAKKQPKFKKVVAIALAAIIGAGIAIGAGITATKQTQTPETNSSAYVEIVDNAENQEKIGIYDGYGEKGMWLSENKTGNYQFACAEEVAEVCQNDEVEMMKYTAENQSESMADYLANLPEEMQPDEFKGLTILETEAKLEAMDDMEYEKLQAQFNQIMDQAFTRRVVLDGEYDNAYMKLKDENGAVTHENMELVKCTTSESQLEVTQFYWVNEQGQEIGSMNVKMTPVYNEDGEIVSFKGCEQVVNEKGSSRAYEGMNEVDEHEDKKEEKKEEEKIKSKDAENLRRIDQQILDAIAKDIGTDKVVVTTTESVSLDDLIEKPSSEQYQGTEVQTQQNEASKQAEDISSQEMAGGDYSVDNGGKNADEYAPVQDNEQSQQAADEAHQNEEAATQSEAGQAFGL